MSKETPNYYAILPSNVRYDKNLSSNEKIMYAEITALTQKNGECWASNNYFAELYNVTPQAISKWIKKLESLNYISIRYLYKENTQMIEKRFIRMVSTHDSKVSTDIDAGINTGLGGYQHRIKGNNTSINNTSINNNPIVPLTNDTNFEDFWKLYPKKINKKKSKSLYKKINDETHHKIITDLEQRVNSKEWRNDNGKFIPHATTYLNGERWNDEIEGSDYEASKSRRVQIV